MRRRSFGVLWGVAVLPGPRVDFRGLHAHTWMCAITLRDQGPAEGTQEALREHLVAHFQGYVGYSSMVMARRLRALGGQGSVRPLGPSVDSPTNVPRCRVITVQLPH